MASSQPNFLKLKREDSQKAWPRSSARLEYHALNVGVRGSNPLGAIFVYCKAIYPIISLRLLKFFLIIVQITNNSLLYYFNNYLQM